MTHKIKDLSGQKFNRVMVVSLSHRHETRGWYWNCLCDYGITFQKLTQHITHSKNVGCLACQRNLSKVNLIGQRFGALVVLKKHEGLTKRSNWVCRCDCGNEIVRFLSTLKRKNIIGCPDCVAKLRADIHTTHGGSRADGSKRLFLIWKGMRRRCCSHPRYAGRGIKICDQWDDFACFRDWAVSNGYNDNLTIDRIDVNGNYEPNNCEWVTKAENSRRSCVSREQKRMFIFRERQYDYILGQLSVMG